MAKKNLYNGELLKTDDWGGKIIKDGVTYDGAEGTAVQNFIKKSFDQKWGCVYDNNKGKYYVFADAESRDIYLDEEALAEEESRDMDPEIAALKLAEMNSYSNYRILIDLNTEVTRPTNAVLVGQTGNKVSFVVRTIDKDENNLTEGLTINYTITRQDASKSNVTHFTETNKTEELQIDKYLTEGKNTIAINVIGATSNAIGNTTVVFQVINLKVEDNYDISTVHNVTNGRNATMSMNWSVTGSSVSNKFVEWYLDGQLMQDDLLVAGSGQDTGRVSKSIEITGSYLKFDDKKISLENTEGRHNVQYRAWMTVDDQKFYTRTYSKDFIVYNGGVNPIIAISYSLPIGIEPLTGSTYQHPMIYDAVQFTSFELPVAVYKNNALNVNTGIEVKYEADGVVKTDVTYSNLVAEGEIWNATITPNVTGDVAIVITAGTGSQVDTYELGADISENELNVHEVTANLRLDLRAAGKSNTASDKDVWSYQDGPNEYTTEFYGVTFDETSGWNDNTLVLSNGDAISINYQPLNAAVANSGLTFELEFSTFNVSNDDAVILDMRSDNSSAGLIMTASEAKFSDSYGNTVSTKFKSNENYRIAFVVDPDKSGEKPLILIYVNGAVCGGIGYSRNANFNVTKNIRIQSSAFAGVKIKHIRIYSASLTADEILNNYMLYRDTYREMEDLYNRNDLYVSSGVFNLDKIANILPIMLITDYDQERNFLDNLMSFTTADKKTPILVRQVIYINNLDPSTSFCCDYAQITPQGTSSMNYPIKNLRLYIKDKAKGKYGEWPLPILYTGDTSNPETMVSLSNPYGTGVGSKPGKGKIAFKSGLSGTFSEGERKAQAVNCWTLKADYAESSSSHNTGVARIWNQVMRDAILNGVYVSRTRAQASVMSEGVNQRNWDVRTCVDGFPCVVFHRTSLDDNNWRFVGKYNFNNDKSTESVFGFCDIPGIDYQEYDYVESDETEYNNAYATTPNDCKETVENFADASACEKKVRKKLGKEDYKDEETGEWVRFEITEEDYIAYTETLCATPYEYSKTYQKASITINNVARNTVYKKKIKTAGDTSNKVYCVEVLENEAAVTNFTADVEEFDRDWAHGFEFRYPEIEGSDQVPDAECKGGLTNLRDFYAWCHSTMYTESAYDNVSTVTINGESKPNGSLVYKQTETKYQDNGTYSVANYAEFKDMMKKKFQKEKWDYIDVFKMAAYYVYLMRFGAVDQVCKNSMLTSEGTVSFVQNTTTTGGDNGGTKTVSVEYTESQGNHCKWFFINYDNDTILGLNNDGQIAYGPDIDRQTQVGEGYWAENDKPRPEMIGRWDTIENPTPEEQEGAITGDYTTIDDAVPNTYEAYAALADGAKYMIGNTLYIWVITANTDYESFDDLKAAADAGIIHKEDGDYYKIGGSVWQWRNESSYAYAGHNSVLWNNLEDDDEFMNIVRDMDDAIYRAGLSYNNVIKMFNDKQATMWCEHILNDDANNKYIQQYEKYNINHLSKMHGPRTSHRMWWLSKRFTYFDSKFVSGEYIGTKILLKIQGVNSDPTFTIKPTEFMNYGWGVTNRSLGKTGVSSEKDEHGVFQNISFYLPDGNLGNPVPGEPGTYSYSQGDPVEIYASPYISELDLSNFSVNLMILDLHDMPNPVLGTQLKRLILGKEGRVNGGSGSDSLTTIGSLDYAEKLEYIDLQGFKDFKDLDVSRNLNMREVYAPNSGLQGISFANGAKIEKLTLPNCYGTLKLDSVNYLTKENIIFENGDLTSLHTISISNCEALKSSSFDFLKEWYMQKDGNVTGCDVVVEGVEWNITYAELDIIEQLKAKCNKFVIKGSINITDTIEVIGNREENKARVLRIKTLFGDKCFLYDENPPVVVTCTVPFIIINGTETEITAKEGNSVTYSCEVYPSMVDLSMNPTITYTIVEGEGYQTREGVTCSTNTSEFTGTLITDELIVGATSTLVIKATYTWPGGNVFESEMELVIKDPTYPANSGNLQLSGPTSLKNSNVYQYSLNVNGTNGKPATGTYSVEWIFDKNSSQYIDYAHCGIVHDNQLRFQVATTDLEPQPSETIDLTARVTTYGGSVVNTTIRLLVLNSDVILTSLSNPVIMAACDAAGWANDPDVLTKQEAMNVRNIGDAFCGLTGTFGFHEFVEFENVQSVPNGAFMNSGLTGITLPSSVTTLGDSAFTNCQSLENITFSNNNIVDIPEYCFCQCQSLNTLTLPSSVKKLKKCSFYNTGFNKIALSNENEDNGVLVVPNTLTDILEYAFENYTLYNGTVLSQPNDAIVSIELPDSLGSIEGGHFDTLLIRGSKITGFTASDNNQLYSTPDNVLYNKSQMTLYKYPSGRNDESYSPVIACLVLYDYAFANTKLILLNLSTARALRTMGTHQFEGSVRLVSVDMSECADLREITDYAFNGCYALTTIQYPNSIEAFGDSIFYMCNSMTNIVIPNGVQTIGQYLINKCDGITTLELPDSITGGSPSYTIAGCANLESVKFPKYMPVNSNLCDACPSLTGVTLPVATYYDENDRNVQLNATYTRFYLIGQSNLNSFVEFALPEEDNNNLFFVENGIIYRKDDGGGISLANVPFGLNSIEMKEGTTRLVESVFQSHINLTDIVVPDSVTNIEGKAFMGCTNLTTAVVGTGVTEISGSLFQGCNVLHNVVFKSKQLNKIHYSAFASCPKLSAITLSSLAVPSFAVSTNFNKNGHHPFGDIVMTYEEEGQTKTGGTRVPSTFTGKDVTGAKKLKVQYFTEGAESSLTLYKTAQYWSDPLFTPVDGAGTEFTSGCGFDTEYLTFSDELYVKFYDENDEQYEYDGQTISLLPHADGTIMGEYQDSGDYAGYYKFSLGANVISNKPIMFTKGPSGDSFGTLRPLAFEDHAYALHMNAAGAVHGMMMKSSKVLSSSSIEDEDTVSRYEYNKLVSRLNSLESKLRKALED